MQLERSTSCDTVTSCTHIITLHAQNIHKHHFSRTLHGMHAHTSRMHVGCELWVCGREREERKEDAPVFSSKVALLREDCTDKPEQNTHEMVLGVRTRWTRRTIRCALTSEGGGLLLATRKATHLACLNHSVTAHRQLLCTCRAVILFFWRGSVFDSACVDSADSGLQQSAFQLDRL